MRISKGLFAKIFIGALLLIMTHFIVQNADEQVTNITTVSPPKNSSYFFDASPSLSSNKQPYNFPNDISFIELYRGGGDIISPTPPPFSTIDDYSKIEEIGQILSECTREKESIAGLGFGLKVATFEMRLSNDEWLYFIKTGKQLYFNDIYNYADLYVVPDTSRELLEFLIGGDSSSSKNFLFLDAPLSSTLDHCSEFVSSPEMPLALSPMEIADTLVSHFLDLINKASPFRTFLIQEYTDLTVHVLCDADSFTEYGDQLFDCGLMSLQDNEWIIVCNLKAKISGYYNGGENLPANTDENGFSNIGINVGILKYSDGKYIFFPGVDAYNSWGK